MIYRRKVAAVEHKVPVQKRYPAGLYRRTAFVYTLRAFILPLAVVTFLYGVYQENFTFKVASVAMLAGFFLLTLLFWGSCNNVLCRICKTPFLKHLKCSKKKGKIPHFLGDRSLATSISLVLRRPHITCQYCAERHKYFE